MNIGQIKDAAIRWQSEMQWARELANAVETVAQMEQQLGEKQAALARLADEITVATGRLEALRTQVAQAEREAVATKERTRQDYAKAATEAATEAKRVSAAAQSQAAAEQAKYAEATQQAKAAADAAKQAAAAAQADLAGYQTAIANLKKKFGD